MAKIRTTTSQILLVLVAITLVLTVINLGYTLSLGKKIANTEIAPAQGNNPQAPTQPVEERVKFDITGQPVKGDSKAKVTIIEVSDFQCPYCGRFFSQTYPSIEADYIKTGKVKLVFVNFPLSFHPNAQKAAEAAECAGLQGKFWEMHDKLFANQAALSVENLKQYAKDLGLDTAKFDKCLDNGEMASTVQKDFAAAQAVGVQGTPSFLIGNPSSGYQKFVGAQPYANFKVVIDAELEKAK